MNGMPKHRYILLPETGAVAPEGAEAELLSNLPSVHSTEEPVAAPIEGAGGQEVQIVDSAREDGPKLVEASAEAAEAVNESDTPLRMLPEVEYPDPNPPLQAFADAVPAGALITLEVTCVDAENGDGVPGANVIAFTDFAQRIGAKGTTDGFGAVTLTLGSTEIERLYVYPPLAGYWGAFQQGVGAGQVTVPLTPIDLSFVDSVRHYYGSSKFDPETGVQVGVIDTGGGPHGDLNLISGVNTVTGEPRNAANDERGHGTHVAGLIGSNGAAAAGLRGLAPGVPLRAYRVFPKGTKGATNYSILKAMIFAANDGCDIVNLSLGGGPADWVVQEAVADARNSGMLVMVAAGNNGRAPVSFPAAYPQATAVSALGREGTFPPGSLEQGDVLRPPGGNVPDEFIASFSNIGPQIAVTAPGVGALSTVPDNGFGAMSGTSMASPVASGAVACLLSRDPGVFAMERNAARSQAIATLLSTNCKVLGFGPGFEGMGMPDPESV
jgi:subtilisin family serine protease